MKMKSKNKKQFTKRSKDQNFIVKENSELLSFLLAKKTNLSRNSIKNLLKNRQIAVNGVPTTQFNFTLVKEDLVTVLSEKSFLKAKMNLPIIYEDDDFIVIDKPHDLLSVPSDDLKKTNVYQILSNYVQQDNKRKRIYIVHRLDEGTSGVMLVAKNEKIRNLLQKNWNEYVIKRQYIAVVEGRVLKKEETLKHFLAENQFNLMYVTKNPKAGKQCITKYKVLQSNESFSMLEVEILSGRKNQIRVQLGYIGHFVLGDDKYGHPPNPYKRLALHASELSFFHPLKKKMMSFKSPIPKQFKII